MKAGVLSVGEPIGQGAQRIAKQQIERDVLDCQAMADALLTISLHEADNSGVIGRLSGATWLATELMARLRAIEDGLIAM